MKKKDFKYYKHLGEIPIYNWYMLHKDDSFNWLLIGDKDEKLTRIQAKKLSNTYKSMLEQFDSINLPLLKKKAEIAIKVIDFVKESLNTTDLEVLKNASVIMRALLVTPDPDISWLHDVKIAENSEQRLILTDLAVAVKAYNQQKAKEDNREEIKLQDNAARLTNILGVVINVRECSVLEFMAFQKEANEKIKING